MCHENFYSEQKDGIWANFSKQAVTSSKLIKVLFVVLLWRTMSY